MMESHSNWGRWAEQSQWLERGLDESRPSRVWSGESEVKPGRWASNTESGLVAATSTNHSSVEKQACRDEAGPRLRSAEYATCWAWSQLPHHWSAAQAGTQSESPSQKYISELWSGENLSAASWKCTLQGCVSVPFSKPISVSRQPQQWGQIYLETWQWQGRTQW